MPNSKPAKPAAKSEKAAPVKKEKPAKSAVTKDEAPSVAEIESTAEATPAPAPAEKKPKAEKKEKVIHSNEQTPLVSARPPADRSFENLSPFLGRQRERLLHLRDNILDSMNGVAKDTLRSRAEGSEASAFGMHQADAGSDSYDRDFALSLLSQEQDALYEIEEALKRIEQGAYGVCEMSGKPIAHSRLEAIPFARYTVECQAQIEKQNKLQRTRTPVTSLFGLTDGEEGSEGEEEESTPDTKE